MRQMFLSLVVLLSLVSIGAAAPACVPGTLTTYIALGSTGCTVGTTTFANFAYAAKSTGGAPQISSDQVQVTPSFQVPATGGFMFSAKWSVTGNQTQQSRIKYTVMPGMASSSGNLMLQLGTTHMGTFGAAVVREMTTAGNLQVFVNCREVCRSQTSAQLPFTPTAALLQVTDDVNLSGTASLDSFTALADFCPLCV